MKWIVKCDGGCPANPGPGAFAFVIEKPDGEKITRSGFASSATNNQMEYRAVNAAALSLLQLGELPEDVEIWSDSQVIVRQLNGVYKVNDDLRPYYAEAWDAIRRLRARTRVVVDWFRRENNQEADELCNQVLERRGIVIVSKKRKAA